jgi:hypothetical protein
MVCALCPLHPPREKAVAGPRQELQSLASDKDQSSTYRCKLGWALHVKCLGLVGGDLFEPGDMEEALKPPDVPSAFEVGDIGGVDFERLAGLGEEDAGVPNEEAPGLAWD